MPTARRSRMQRTRTGKRLALTTRDLELFRSLARYRYLRSTYLHTFVGGASETRFKERLGDLFHEGFLDRPAEQWRFADCRFLPVVHELGKDGRDALIRTDGGLPESITWLGHGAHRQFEHSLMICAILASIELATRDRRDIRFIPLPEILAKAPESTQQSDKPYLLSSGNTAVVPDAIFGLEYRQEDRKAFRFFALEADRGTMPIARVAHTGTSVLAKMEAYRRIMEQEAYRRTLGIPNLLILIVTTGEARCTEMMAKCSGIMADGRSFLFRAFASATAPDTALLSAPWRRPGAPPLNIAQ